MIIKFEIPGKPKGQERSRSTRSGHHYKTRSQTGWEEKAGYAMAKKRPPMALAGPLRCVLTFYHATPASWSKKLKFSAIALSMKPTSKPDIDNCVKAVFDVCNKRIWKDDTQVVEVWATKCYGEEAKTVVEITEL